MRALTADELETPYTIPLYRVESKNKHTQWHCKCKLCEAETDLYTDRIKTYRCNCRLKTYAPKQEDQADKVRKRIRERDNRRLQRAGLVPQGMVIHHLYMLRCNHTTTEAILDGVMILTPEQHEQWHREHPKYEVPIHPELN